MVGKESEVQKNQVPVHVAELELDVSPCWASRTEDGGFPRGSVLVSARDAEPSEWGVRGLICISP